MIVNIRGANCAGKTTLLRSMLNGNSAKQVVLDTYTYDSPTMKDRWRKLTVEITATVVEHDWGEVCVIGRFNNQGQFEGMDGWSMKGVHDAFERAISQAAKDYEHVIYEGIMVSSSYERYAKLAKYLTQPTVWLFLKVDADEAIRRKYVRTPDKTLKNGGKSIRDKVEMIQHQIDVSRKDLRFFTDVLDEPDAQTAYDRAKGWMEHGRAV